MDESVPGAFRKLRRSSELRRLWCHEQAFASHVSAALRAQLLGPGAKADPELRVFLDNVVTRLIAHPSDLASVCDRLDDEALSREFLRFYVRHELADHDVLFTLVESPALFKSLPDDPQWMEVAVLLYGSAKLDETDGRKLSIAEIAPLGLDTERATVRSLIGSAFDAGLLVDEDRERLLTLFPNDAYFGARLR